jgi:hypothetical protein
MRQARQLVVWVWHMLPLAYLNGNQAQWVVPESHFLPQPVLLPKMHKPPPVTLTVQACVQGSPLASLSHRRFLII